MIVFEEIKWKNFLSTGNSFTEVKIDDAPSHLILGSNGAGKSTLLDALCFVLFNKPFRKIIRRQLINSINERECLVEIKFHIGSVKYKVIRGIKPNVFEIYRNGQLLDQDAANKDYPSDKTFGGPLMCGKEGFKKSRGEYVLNKSGEKIPNFICEHRLPFKYFAVVDSDGETVKTYKDESLIKLEKGQKVEKRDYKGCPHFFNTDSAFLV